MSNYKTNKNYTLIEELPELEELERGNHNRSGGINMIPPDNANQIQKFIRNNVYEPPIESGMSQRQQPPPIQQPQPIQQPPPPVIQDFQVEQFIPQSKHNHFIEEPQFYQPPMYRQHQQHSYDINCINVADHTTNCVVCSRLYQHNTSGYIVIIILLSIICILLLKRVLNV
jgi:hypothetical protein